MSHQAKALTLLKIYTDNVKVIEAITYPGYMD
jgi:hypothetical protein